MTDKELIELANRQAEAMKQALEALELEEAQTAYPNRWLTNAITALRKALANETLDKKAENARELGLDYEPAQQKFVSPGGGYVPAIPAQRQALRADTWVGLTDEEKVQLWNHDTDAPLSYADAIEAKLKAKNSL